jgi:integrase
MVASVGGLTAVAIRNAKPGEKPKRLFDGAGMYLEVMPNGSRYWRLKYRYAGKEKRLALGVFPEVTLADARGLRDSAREALRAGLDPGAEKKATKVRAVLNAATTFEAIALEWLETQRAKLAASTFEKAQWMLVDTVFPWMGALPIAKIEAPEVLATLRRIEARGANETAHRTRERIAQVFRYAIATGRAKHNPVGDLRGALSPVVRTSRAAITDPAKVGDLLRAIDGYTGQFVTRCALKLAPLLFVRPGELRKMEWAELDLGKAEWRIPAAKMKMREEHIVPLAPQAVAILRDLEPLTGPDPRRPTRIARYSFPSLRSGTEHMSENTVNAALRRLGFDKETMTGHGFRALASTRLNELGWAPEVIERQLAHAERNSVRAAYNRAQYMKERRQMMGAWADYLDGLRADTGKVIPILRKASR